MQRPSLDRRRAVRPRTSFVLTLVVAALALPPLAGAVGRIDGITPAQLPDYDSRAAVEPTADRLAAAQALGASVTWNDFGTPASVVRFGGFLAAGIAAPDAAGAARQWLTANAALFGLDSAASLRRLTAAPLAGAPTVHAVVFQQASGGLVSTDGIVTVGVLGSAQAGWKVSYASSNLTGEAAPTGSEALDPVQAWTQAANGVGISVSVLDVTVKGKQGDTTTLEVNGVHGDQTVRKSRFGTPKRGARLAFAATVQDQSEPAAPIAYEVVLDAETGALLARQSLVDYATDDPTWMPWPALPQSSPINRFPWNYQSADTRDLWCWTSLPSCKFDAQDTIPAAASKVAWDVDAATNASTLQTAGNNADSIERWVNSGPRQWGVGHHATSASRDYVYPWSNAWFLAGCNPAVLAGSGNDIDAAIANLFDMHNRMHDWSYYLGFDEAHWNAQQVNHGLGGADGDAVLGNAQSSAISGGAPNYGGRDNANMSTPPDGRSPTTNMYLWQPLPGAFYAPCVDGDYDMGVIGHEYGHAIENRMIGKGNRRSGTHAGAMGEAFGDFDALEYLNEFGYAPQNGSDPWTEGSYVTGNHYNGIRDYLASEPMGGDLPQPGANAKTDPLNFSDYGFDTPGPEVHADGEIWVAVQYDIRDLMLQRYPSNGQAVNVACARGQRPAGECPGNRRWIQLYYDAMVLMPSRPTMLDARDAMLAADMARFGGANQDVLWKAFARRGFGQGASVTSSQDTDPVPDFSSPLEQSATLVFRAVSNDGSALPVAADVFVGDYEARVTPIADTDPATALDDTAPFVATGQGRYTAYNFVANAPGYGHVRFQVRSLKPGETRTVTIRFPTNYASQAQGASASGDGTGQSSLIDDTEATNWASTGAPVQGRQVVVHLGGGAPVTFDTINVSAMIGPGINRFTALRAFELYACSAGAAANPTCDGSTAAGWTRILASRQDAFPSVNPRPVGPDLILRTWNVPKTTATHVRFVVVANQCTGQDSYHGDQDADPANNSDCRIGQPPFAPRDAEVHAAELQVLSSQPTVEQR